MKRNILRTFLLLMLAALLLVPSALAECDHPETRTEECYIDCKWDIIDENSHDIRGVYAIQIVCNTCNKWIKDEYYNENYSATESHKFELISTGEYVCECGLIKNTCTHPMDARTNIEEYVPNNTKVYSNITSTHHTYTGSLMEASFCTACGNWADDVLIQANYTLTETHFFWEGKCLCGAKEGAEAPQPVKPTKIHLYDDGPLTINLGDSTTLNFYFTPSNASSEVKWTTSSKKVATVDDGVVTAVKEGTATITVKTANGKKDTVKVKVVDPYKPSKVTLAESGTVTLNMGDTLTLSAALSPETAKSTLKWSSSSKKVATVDDNGVVTPVKEGTATITVKTHNGKKDTVKVKVVDPFKPSKVTLDQSKTVILNMGETLTLNAALSPETAKSTLKWSSSSKKVATVDENGVVTPMKEGTATITVKTHNGKKDTVKVKVVDPFKATGIKAVSSKLTVTEGDTFTPEYTLTPATATSAVKITSSSKKVLKVNADGTVTALKKGSAKLTLKTSTGKKATIKVTVNAKPVTPSKPDVEYDAMTQAIVDEMSVRLAAGQYETALKLMMDYCDDGQWTWLTALFNEGLINEEFHVYLCDYSSAYAKKFGGSKLPTDDGKDDEKPATQYTMDDLRAMAKQGNFSSLYDMHENGVITEEQHLRLMEEFEEYHEFVKNGGTISVTPSVITTDYILELYKTSNYAKMSELYASGRIPADVHAEVIEITGDNHYWSPVISDGDKDDKNDQEPTYSIEILVTMAHAEMWDDLANLRANGEITDEQFAYICELYPDFYDAMLDRGVE